MVTNTKVIKILYHSNVDGKEIAGIIQDALKKRYPSDKAKVDDKIWYGIRVTVA